LGSIAVLGPVRRGMPPGPYQLPAKWLKSRKQACEIVAPYRWKMRLAGQPSRGGVRIINSMCAARATSAFASIARRLRFRLRTLMVLIALASAGLAWA